jgi:hypothetical protein
MPGKGNGRRHGYIAFGVKGKKENLGYQEIVTGVLKVIAGLSFIIYSRSLSQAPVNSTLAATVYFTFNAEEVFKNHSPGTMPNAPSPPFSKHFKRR